MKAKDLRERTTDHLKELEKQLNGDVFQARFKNFTNRLDDTSSIKKAKKDLARVKTVLTQHAKGLSPVAKSAAPATDATTTEEAPKAKAKKAAPKVSAKSAAGEKPAAAKKTAPKKTAKKSEAE